MKCQEHNRSKKGTLREKKKQDPTSTTVQQEKDDISNRRQISPQGIYPHFGFSKNFPHQITDMTVFLLIRKHMSCISNHFDRDGKVLEELCLSFPIRCIS